MVGAVVNSKIATLYELQTLYGLEDLHDLYEIILIKVANEQKIMEKAKERRRR